MMAAKAKRKIFFAAVSILCLGAFAGAQIVINGSPDANSQSLYAWYKADAISAPDSNIADNEPFCGQPGTQYLEADLNRDCYVNLPDLLQLVVDWLECSDPSNDTCNYGSLPLAPVWSDIFTAGENGINTYRIPSIVTALDGTLLAFCEARKISSSDKSPTKMVLKRSFDNGRSWAAMQVLHDVGNDATMDPTAIVDQETGKIWLLYELYPYGWNSNVVAGLTYPSCTVWVTSSADNGAVWSQPKDITAQVKMPDWTYYSIGPGVGIQTLVGHNTGRMILPCHHGAGTVDPKHIFYSDDHGASWQIGAGFIPAGTESQMVELIDGTYYMNIRGGGAAGRKISYSYDEGDSWSPIINDPILIEPSGCQASAIRYTRTDGGYAKNRILFSNPASVSSRVNMTVRLSYDEGKTWAASKSIYAGPSAYSCLTILRDGSIGLMWESGKSGPYEKITFVRFNLAWLTDGQDYLPTK